MFGTALLSRLRYLDIKLQHWQKSWSRAGDAERRWLASPGFAPVIVWASHTCSKSSYLVRANHIRNCYCTLASTCSRVSHIRAHGQIDFLAPVGHLGFQCFFLMTCETQEMRNNVHYERWTDQKPECTHCSWLDWPSFVDHTIPVLVVFLHNVYLLELSEPQLWKRGMTEYLVQRWLHFAMMVSLILLR